jgi:cytochrome c oxidase subunit 4
MTAHPIAQDGDHVPHVLSVNTYLKTWAALLVLTGVTVGASYVNLGHSGNVVVALLIAAIKATVVAAIFMHLRYDKKFNSIIIMMSGLFLAVMIIFTMADTETRGSEDPSTQSKPKDMKHPFPKVAAPAAAPAAPAASAAPAAP